jgi:subtilisin-like proprotein convertase family protein
MSVRRAPLGLSFIVLLAILPGCGDPAPPELLVRTPFFDRAETAIPVGRPLERRLDVAGAGTVRQATAEAILRHPAPADLTVAVTSPAGTRVALGGWIAEGNDYLRYAVPLLAAQGEPASGPWRLTVTDAGSRGPGTLIIWAVELP